MDLNRKLNFALMNSFDEQTINDLEFSIIRDWLTEYAIGDTAKQRLVSLLPSNRFSEVKIELKKVHELHNIRTEGEKFPSLDFEEILKEIKLLPIKNAVLTQEGFYRIYRASNLVNELLYFFDKRTQEYPLLSTLTSQAYYSTEIIDSIDKVFDKTGSIKDEASPYLATIRSQLKIVKSQINKNF